MPNNQRTDPKKERDTCLHKVTTQLKLQVTRTKMLLQKHYPFGKDFIKPRLGPLEAEAPRLSTGISNSLIIVKNKLGLEIII